LEEEGYACGVKRLLGMLVHNALSRALRRIANCSVGNRYDLRIFPQPQGIKRLLPIEYVIVNNE